MSQQKFVFKDTQNVNINLPNHESPESKTEPVNARFESSHLKELKAFCFDHKITLSECLRDSTKLYIELYPYLSKIQRYWKALIAWLENI